MCLADREGAGRVSGARAQRHTGPAPEDGSMVSLCTQWKATAGRFALGCTEELVSSGLRPRRGGGANRIDLRRDVGAESGAWEVLGGHQCWGGVRRTMGASGFGMGFGGSVVADASRCLGASQEPCRLLGRPWASGGRAGSAVSPVKTRWKPARIRRAPCCLLRRRPGLQEDVLLPPCGQEELVRRWR